jgi:hypothetical protein
MADNIKVTAQDFPEPVAPNTAKFFASSSSISTNAGRLASW